MKSLLRIRYWPAVVFSFTAMLLSSPCFADSPDNVLIGPVVVIGSVGHGGRSPVHTDAIEAKIVSGAWHRPAAGDHVELPKGESKQWSAISTNKDGWFEKTNWNGGYAYAPVIAASDCVRILEAQGHGLVYVNGELRPGDPYEYGYVRLPVSLHAGTNDFLFQSGGHFKFNLAVPSSPVSLNTNDTTLPDLIAGQSMDTWGAVVVVNATAQTQSNLTIRASINGNRAVAAEVPAILPFSARKVGFQLRSKELKISAAEATVPVRLTLDEGKHAMDEATISLRVRRPDQVQKRTFISEIDRSVQYWALNPAQPRSAEFIPRVSTGTQNSRNEFRAPVPLAMFFSLHGASVEARGQAEAYEAKSWGNIVVPTNRRPFGFDWEDWGRLDALEVLKIAKAELHPDPQRIYLTGHSMGGHGSWQLGALFPGYFAADGVSAGWISFFSYAEGARFTNRTPIEAILQRASATSDTLLMKSNFLQEGVYILHGSEDDNVPVTEARQMRTNLAVFDHDFEYHEQPGQSHWWDLSDEPGADCVDWPPMFDYFARHSIPRDEDVREINFTTVNPGVSSKNHWLEIEQQIHALEPSSIDVRWDPGKRRFVGTTTNIARLAFDLSPIAPGKALKVELDGQTLDGIPWPANEGKLWLEQVAGKWRVASSPSFEMKGPQRNGPFKDAFRHHMVFVYGTKGTAEENAWALAKARFDAETFWYRGNGSVDVIPDTALKPDPDRGVILYGNADSNGAWSLALCDSPVQVHRNKIKIGDHVFSGSDLACLFLRPSPGSATGCIGVVSGTGIKGMKLTDRLNYFLSGVEFPDCTIIGPEMLRDGAKGVRAAGFFGNDWSVDQGDFAWLTSLVEN